MAYRGRVLAVAAALLLAGCGTGSPGSTSTTSADYQNGYAVGLKAYVYGLPLMVTDATYQAMTSIDVSQGAFGPVNQFNNVRSPNGSGSTAVVAPGATSLSSIAWVDLTGEPQVLHVPEVTDHFFVLALLDPYTENIVNLGSASSTPEGNYVLVDPAHRGVTIPQGAKELDVDYARIWIIGSTQLKGASDIPAVNKIQDGYTLTPLSRFGTTWTPSVPANPITTVLQRPIPTGVQFFDQLGADLQAFPPPNADAPLLAELATVGIGAGRTPSTDRSLSADTLRGLSDAVAAGPQQVQADTKSLFAQDFPTHDGYLLGGFGSYGTNYAERAVISQIGLGAFVPQQAIYAMTWTDHAQQQLAGSSSYTVHLAQAPPTVEGWSVTVYTDSGTLVSGPDGRTSALTNISPLTTNPDGSIDLYLQPTQPSAAAQAANWIPTPKGQGFEVTWRLFAPDASAVSGILDGSGWQPPAIAPAS
ncbi:MAG: DUF1254 domain-containing protein [Candidatus Nanopelagicales bacterium]